MKVLCVNSKPTKYSENLDLDKISEGETYVVEKILPTPDGEAGYILKDIYTDNPYGYWHKRFIPVSDKDETEYADEVLVKIFQPVKF